MYSGPVKHSRPLLGIKPTAADRNYVRALALIGVGVRVICERLGERFELGKPMSRMTLYHHFRKDLEGLKRGRPAKPATLKRRVEANVLDEMRRLVAEVSVRTSGRAV